VEAAPHGPDDAGHLVGDGHGGLVVDVGLFELVGPVAQVIGLFLSSVEQDRSRAVDEEGAQVPVAALGVSPNTQTRPVRNA
jgi:hypothetical protein